MSIIHPVLTCKRVQAIAAALVIGATALTLSATPAAAKDNIKMCTWISQDGTINFVLPGEADMGAPDQYARICQANGTWQSLGPGTVREVPVREPREPRGRGGR